MIFIKDYMSDLSKEIVVSLLSMAVGAIWHKARGAIRDLNRYFARVRALEERISKLERGDQ